MGTGGETELTGSTTRPSRRAAGAEAAAELPANSAKQQREGYRIYLMRHGIAADRGFPDAADDATRALTPKGRAKMQRAAKGLLRTGFEVDWVVASPLTRAVETAEIVCESLAVRAPLDSCSALQPGGSPEDLLRFLAKQPDRWRVLLVGHEPDLSTLASSLIGSPRPANLAFKKGGCCLIEFDQFPWAGPGLLVWWLTPRLLRAMAGG